MKHILSVTLAAASLLAVAGYAFAVPEYLAERAEASRLLEGGSDRNDAEEDSRQASLAAQRGDWAVARAFAERSYRENPTIIVEFNLATAYQRTGRPDLAIPLYLDLVDRGQFTRTVPLDNYYQLPQLPMLANIADEAAARLERMGAGTAVAGPIKPYPTLVLK